jgi:hypothetical protein
LKLLAGKSGVGLVAGRLENIPVRAGLTPAFPYLGITPPPPNYLLEDAKSPEKSAALTAQRMMRRFGVTHGVWEASTSAGLGETLYVGPDPALDRVVPHRHDAPVQRTWRIVAYPGAFPGAHVALRVRSAANWGELYSRLSQFDSEDEAWYLREDLPPDDGSARALAALLVSWDGRTAIVEHDGTCHLVIRRTYYPGWTARLNDGASFPVLKADGGLQAVRVPGAGVTRIELAYRPTHWQGALRVSLAAIAAVALLLAISLLRELRGRRRQGALS